MKRMIVVLVLAAGGMLVPVGRAAAAEIDTPSLHILGSGLEALISINSRCMIVNASDKPITVNSAEIVDQNGNTAATAMGMDVPAWGAAVLVETSSASANQAFCRVIGRFSKRHVQVTLCAASINAPPPGACYSAVTAP